MKSVIFRLGGSGSTGDVLVVNAIAPKGDMLVLSCSDIYADVIFTGEVQGKATETIEEV